MSPPRPIPDVSPTSAFRRWPGREEWHGHQLGGGSPVSAAFCRRRGGESGLVDHRQRGRALGYREAFARQHPHDVFREHAALSGFENDGQRAFDIGALADLSREAWDAMPPVRWPVSRSEVARDITRGWHGDGRLRMVPVTPQPTRATTDAFIR